MAPLRFFLAAALSVALAAASNPLVLIEDVYTAPTVGKPVHLQWMTATADPLTLQVVRQTKTGWDLVDTLFKNVAGTPCVGSHTWEPNSTYSSDEKYAVYIESAHYAAITNFFHIKPAKQ